MSKHTYAILLAGGQGSRFWPQSRTLEPKQFLALHKKTSLFEQTVRRILPLISAEHIVVVSSQLYRHQIAELVAQFNIPQDNLIFEPDGRNTAPSVALGVKLIHQKDDQALVCVLPCDHLIKENKRFLGLLKDAFAVCKRNLVIFGIVSTRPATGYGYIQRIADSGQRTGKNKIKVFPVKRFTEKPDLKTAEKFIKDGNYYWNSGIFVGSTQIFLQKFKLYQQLLWKQLDRFNQPDDITKIWSKVPAISFDYGILERSHDLIMLVASDLGWSDLGSWQAWDELLKKDKDNNIFKADVVSIASKNITVVGTNRLIATIGLDDLIVVDTPDALLITKKDRTEEVKKVVDILKAKKRQEHYAHKTVKRPWGAYTVLEIGEGFKVKLVEVKPKHALSLQYHKKRSEHWVVVEGIAQITNGKKVYTLEANESTYIPKNALHRLYNPSRDAVLKIVEVQAGKYLEEDDIVRLKDDFGRS